MEVSTILPEIFIYLRGRVIMFWDWYACPRRGTPHQISALAELPVSEYNNRPSYKSYQMWKAEDRYNKQPEKH